MLFTGSLIATISVFIVEYWKKEKKRTQIFNDRLQLLLKIDRNTPTIDSITPREYAINQISKRRLVWDENLKMYVIRNQIN